MLPAQIAAARAGDLIAALQLCRAFDDLVRSQEEIPRDLLVYVADVLRPVWSGGGGGGAAPALPQQTAPKRGRVQAPKEQKNEELDPGRLRTVRQVAEECPAFTEGGLRWAIFKRRENGLDAALVRRGRRVLIDMDKFSAWLETRES